MVHIDTYCTCCPIGKKHKLYIADTIAKNLYRTKVAVSKEDWDYMAIVGGIPGVGKSTFAQAIAKFLDPDFEQEQICFTSKEFIEKTEHGKKGQAFVLDESFADMNSSLYKDPEFISLLNHIQAVRQMNLYLIIVLPDFFTLIKNVAVFRASHLFVPYTVDYSRGDVAVFDREAKRQLYFKGKKECNYKAVEPNFYSDFQMHWFCDKQEYDRRKLLHLTEQKKVKNNGNRFKQQRDILAAYAHLTYKISEKDVAELFGVTPQAISDWIKCGNLWLLSPNHQENKTKLIYNMDNGIDVSDDKEEEDDESSNLL